MLKLFPAVFLFLQAFAASADSLYVRRITDTLSAPYFFGRGYVRNGMSRAASFIANEMTIPGIVVQKQSFRYPVNYFPARMELFVDGQRLQPGKDFLCDAGSLSCKTSGMLEQADSNTFIDRQHRVIFQVKPKLTWTVSTSQSDFASIQLAGSRQSPKSYQCLVDSKLEKNFQAYNIIGVIKGSAEPDSFMVYTAHYDHLGGMGDNLYFPGANDNAAGVGLLLSLSRYYKSHPPKFSVMFIAFAGEEAGLIGSKYFTEHPLVPLKQMKFLINLDLVGNGDEGITVVNATEYPAAFQLLQDISRSGNLIQNIQSRGKAANSDHYWFTEKGVPSFFIYTLGKRKDYHDISDVAPTLSLVAVDAIETLVTRFADALIIQSASH